MKFLTILGLIFYTVVMCVIAGVFISFSLHWIHPEYINNVLYLIYSDIQTRQVVFIIALLLLILNLFFTQLIIGKWQSEKTIAFKMPTGEVTIALSAVEDLIKKTAVMIPEIKELKPNVIAGKKNNIDVNIRLVLRSETNIPDITSKLQEMIKSKIQELGIDAEIIARIHVAKIISQEDRHKKDKKEGELTKGGPTVPFGGYGSLNR